MFFVFVLQFMKNRKDDERRSIVSGKKIKMKIKKSSKDKEVCESFLTFLTDVVRG